MIARHVGQHGYVCPGDGVEHPAHPTRDLTLDHVTALIDGGAPFDPANTRVLCRSRNSANGARLVNARRADRGSPHEGLTLAEVRASQSCARGRVSPFLSRRERGGGAGVVGQSGGQRAPWAKVGAHGRSQAGYQQISPYSHLISGGPAPFARSWWIEHLFTPRPAD